MIKQQLSFQTTHMLNLDSKIHVLYAKGNQRTEIWEELSTVTVAIESLQSKRDATYDENTKPACKPLFGWVFFCKSIPGKVRLYQLSNQEYVPSRSTGSAKTH